MARHVPPGDLGRDAFADPARLLAAGGCETRLGPGEMTSTLEGWPFIPGVGGDRVLRESFDWLRKKWGEVPAGRARARTADMLELSDSDLLGAWSAIHRDSTQGPGFRIRGWYQTLYTDVFRDRKLLDFGCGLAIDTLWYAAQGARVTFVDIVEANVRIVERLCRLRNIRDAAFYYLEDLSSLDDLREDYDVIYCCGSLINAPLIVTALEAETLLKRLPVGGRWIELGYPKGRWEREGSHPFNRWGEKTDGEGTPWMEWHDLAKVRGFLAPAQFEVVLELEFHDGDFNWFDLLTIA